MAGLKLLFHSIVWRVLVLKVISVKSAAVLHVAKSRKGAHRRRGPGRLL